jgi:hypothetical protein
MFSNSFFTYFEDPYARPSVYVISDSQLAEYKAKQAQAEIAELDRLIDAHKTSIERLEQTKAAIAPVASALPSEKTETSQPDSQ